MEIPTRIEVEAGALTLSWEDGSDRLVSARDLRAACPCASCREPDGAQRIDRVLSGLLAVTMSDVRVVGDYALSITFSPDGHSSGIFPYSLLRNVGTEIL
jgi:ATP-binding protein involved in chromosome partitioning